MGSPAARDSRWFIFQEGDKTTSSDALAAARRILGTRTPHAQFGGGSTAYFTELNRGRPDLRAADVICYSINPQVHAFDNTSLMENALAIGYTIQSARQLAAGRPVAISPITLRPAVQSGCDGRRSGAGRRHDPRYSRPTTNVPVRRRLDFGKSKDDCRKRCSKRDLLRNARLARRDGGPTKDRPLPLNSVPSRAAYFRSIMCLPQSASSAAARYCTAIQRSRWQ